MAIQPRIYIGLGSTGAKIISRLKQELLARADERTMEWTYFLAITSEKDREKGVSSEFPFLSLSVDGVGKTKDVVDTLVLNPRQAPEILEETKKWWYWEDEQAGNPWYPPLDDFATGCGGLRPCGRMLLHATAQVQRKLKEIHDYFQQKYTDTIARDSESVDSVEVDTKICRLFGLLAGGTCSGLFLDIPFLIKEVFGHSTVIAGTYLLGDVCHPEKSDATRNRVRQHTQDYNTAFALSELFLLQSKNGRKVLFEKGAWPRTFGKNGKVRNDLFEVRAPAYYRVTLVGARSQLDLSLDGFDSYIDFLGNYYTRLLLADADIGQARGEAVDSQANNANESDETYPYRPNTIELIGMLNIKMPKTKLRAIAANAIITRLSTDDFYNNDSGRYDNCMNRFENALGWAGFYEQFAPAEDDCIKDLSRYTLPDAADSFDKQWQGSRQALDDYYGRCTRREDKDIIAKLEDFGRRAGAVLTDLLQDLLGGLPDRSIEMGSLKYLLNDLLGRDDGQEKGKIALRLEDCQQRIAQTREGLYGNGGSKQIFEETLERCKRDFPSKFTLFKRKWAGQRKVRDALASYRDGLRDLATLSLAEECLKELLGQIRRIGVVRKLIAKYAAYTVFDGYRKEMEKLLDEQAIHDFTNRDVITDKTELDRLADSMLQAVPAKGGTGQTVLERSTAAIADRWRAGSAQDGGVYGCFMEVLSQLERNPIYASNHNQAWELDSIRSRTEGLQRSMRAAVESALTDYLVPEIDGITVWHVLRRALQGQSDIETRLRKRFEVFGKSCALFTRLTGNAKGDDAIDKTLDRTLKFFCSKETAEKACFTPLGMRANLLADLVHGPAGINPKIIDTPASPDIVILYSEVGHDPRYFEGFDEIIEDLLQKVPRIERADEKRWSDRRFPEWISRWAEMGE